MLTGPYNKTIIIAEDNEMNYYLMQAMLSGLGLNILHAWDGSEVFDMCKKNSEIDLVLMDIKMPVMDGFEATRNIKKMRPELPVIAQTAYALAGDPDRIIAAGFDAYIPKPIKKDKLLSLLNSYIKFKHKFQY
jgi:CheY-like chemotaxis protein